MSNALAIAAVTRVLQDLLNNGLIDRDISSRVGGVNVTASAPDRVVSGEARDVNRLNVFLYHVSLNPGWRNVDLPSRNDHGLRVANPPLALDLHYLITAYGAEELNAEILLGYAMQILHETPVLLRRAIREALRTSPPPTPVNGSILPPALRALAASDLADQVELIKITPTSMGAEEMSKLWTAFQTHYRPTAAYQISVVLIESARETRTPFPVLSRGERIDGGDLEGVDQGPVVQVGLAPPYPALSDLILPSGRGVGHPGDDLQVVGIHLESAVSVRLTHARYPETGERALPVRDVGPSEVRFTVPTDDARMRVFWPAGSYTVAVLIDQSGGEPSITNALPLMLAPVIDELTHGPVEGGIEVVIRARPTPRPEQAIRLVVGSREVALHRIDEDRRMRFRVPSPAPGEHLVRLRIDGAENEIIDRLERPPAFRDDAPRITVS